MEKIMIQLEDVLARLQLWVMQLRELKNTNIVVPIEQEPVSVTVPKYNWLTPSSCRMSTRMICDEVGLTVAEKNLICQVVACESGFRTTAKNENIRDGKVLSTDWGICQINDYYHIGKGKDFPSVDYVLSNPEACIRWMIDMYKAGKLNLWICYSKGMYKRYLP